ncbi:MULTISPECIES: DNA methyltransferase [Pasteurellaceae]|uniref:DNA methyltransferase n=1 Tax=Pasteurella atlantica TaxID=2827233 RepID=A0AAW8CKJ9_9PAST|nr:DNA methyltransferase [Pasteurella atlantica]MBR0574661.1 DNA methyltransferase [Pasteurella atlantica]MDP8040576.1 DNA methyltransferase [Pasteurella atlantica]MDP8042709.1 DNA methyltransferase [Pasteurella atlantica]MDP8044790.1 DNA methyltransferase [Pasteurella atlantica]MDP8046890.1 DNA methyltransferase [Pasteurella atlantica]
MAKKRIIIWALFDSGNGCYLKAAKCFSNIKIYSIGIDIENKNNHFIKLNLADYSRLFGTNKLFKKLDRLQKPDVIIASPPCESFSVASAMWGGNASWKQEDKKGSRFVIRNRSDYEIPKVSRVHFRYEKSFLNRINGELCIFNTIEIIKRYQPPIYIIENPYSSRIWDYIEKVLGFYIEYNNPTYYGNYNYSVKKPTKFKSNIPLKLKYENYYSGVQFSNVLKTYNARSNIPLNLIRDIYREIIKFFELV